MTLLFGLLSGPLAYADIPQVCTVNGAQVPSVASFHYAGNAEARIDGQSRPFIIYNPANVAKLPELFRTFAFYHECAHIELGHVFLESSNIQYENEADCWSTDFLSSNGYINYTEFKLLQKQFRSLGWPADAYHLSALDRAEKISQCFSKRTPTKLMNPEPAFSIEEDRSFMTIKGP